MKSELKVSTEALPLSFTKESNGNWYVDLPDWEGEKASLQMVEGADDFLDFLSDSGDKCSLLVCPNTCAHKHDGLLVKDEDTDDGGAWYYLWEHDGVIYEKNGSRMWLCSVTQYVFGHLPDTIKFSQVKIT